MEEEDTRELLLPNWQGSGSMGLTLDKNEEGVFVKQLVQNSPAAKTGVVREGDQIVGATVYFDNMSSEDIQHLLANVGQHTVGLKLQRKGDRSPQPGVTYSHDVFSLKSPDVVLSGDDEEYRRIYTKKIKPRLKSDETLEPETQTRTITVTRKVTAYTVDVTGSKDSKDIDISSPEYKIKIPRHEITEISKSSVETDEGKTVIRIPGIDMSGKSFQAGGDYSVSLPRDSTNIHSSTVRYQQSGGQFEFPEGYTDSHAHSDSRFSLGSNIPGVSVSGSKLQSYEKKIDVKMSRSEAEEIVGFRGPSVAGSSSTDIGLTGSVGNMSDSDISSMDIKVPRHGKTSVTSKVDFLASGKTILDPQLDIEKPEGLKMKGPAISVRTAQADINTSAQSQPVSLTGDIQAPKINIHSQDGSDGSVKLGLAEENIKMPRFQMPKFGYVGPKLDSASSQVTVSQDRLVTATAEVGITPPAVKGETSNINLTGPVVDVKGPEIDMDSSGEKIIMPSFKMPKFGFSGTNDEVTETSMKLPESTVYSSITMGKTSIKTSETKLEGKIEKPIVVDVPKYSIPDAAIDIQSSKYKVENVAGSIIEGDVTGPKICIKSLPQVQVDTSNVGVEGLEGKLRMPKFKLPKFDVPSSKPDGEFNIPDTQVNIAAPENVLRVSVPNADSNVKSVKWEGGANIQAPEIKLGALHANLKDSEELNMSKFGINVPDMNINSAKQNIDLKMPSMNVSLPKVPVSGIDLTLKGPNQGYDLKGPKIDITSPEAHIDAPDVDIDGKIKGTKFKLDVKTSEVDLETPDINLKGSESKLKMPTFGISKPKIEAPNVNVSLPAGNIDVSGANVDIGAPDLNIEYPGGKLKGPSVDMQSMNANLPTLPVSYVDLSLDGNLKGPNITMKSPKVDIEAHDLDIDGKVKGSNFNMPSVQLPKVCIPDIKGSNFEGNFKGPDVDIKGPAMDVDVPNVDLEIPDINIKGSESKLKMPKFKMPKFGLSKPKIEGQNLDANLPTGKIDLSGPNINLEAPDLKGPDIDLSLEGPKANLKSLKVDLKGTEIDVPKPSLIGKGDVDISLPKIEGDIKGTKLETQNPEVDIEVSDINVEGPEGKFKMPKFKMPKFGFSKPGSKVAIPDFDGTMKSPEIEGHLKGADVDIKGPELKLHAPNVDIQGKVEGPKVKIPSMYLPEVSMPDVDLNLKVPR